MKTPPIPDVADEPKLPEEVVSAWASVLLDIYEQDHRQKCIDAIRNQGSEENKAPCTPST